MYYYDTLEPEQCRGEDFDMLLSLGWYPMGQSIFTTSHLFRESEASPPRVHWLRYPAAIVTEWASHRRIRNKNKIFEIELAHPFGHRAELENLYAKYLSSVDFDGYSTIADATYSGNGRNIYDSKAFIVYDDSRVVSCGIFHEGASSAASILHFYDPAYKEYSPGKYLILLTLDYCRSQGFQWYYPGYIIQGNPKMNYKLFLGRESVQYYNPEPHPLSGCWLPFSTGIL